MSSGGFGGAPQGGGYGGAPQGAPQGGGYGGAPQGGYGGAPQGGAPPPNLPRPPPGRPSSLRQCRAVYDFNAEAPTELSFRRGDIITIRKQVNQDWIEGDLNGKIGLLPVNYVEML